MRMEHLERYTLKTSLMKTLLTLLTLFMANIAICQNVSCHDTTTSVKKFNNKVIEQLKSKKVVMEPVVDTLSTGIRVYRKNGKTYYLREEKDTIRIEHHEH